MNARGIPTAAYQVLPKWGTPPPPARSGGYPRWGTPAGVLPHHQGTPGWGTPPPSGPGRGTPPPGVDRQMDRHESKHNLPVVLRTRSVKTKNLPVDFRVKKRNVKLYCFTVQKSVKTPTIKVITSKCYCQKFKILMPPLSTG